MSTRYAITHINREGFRQLTCANQGRNHFDTFEEAMKRREAMLANNVESTLVQTFGPHFLKTVAVRPVECYPSGDAESCYFDHYSPEHDLVSTPEQKAALVRAFASLGDYAPDERAD